MNVNNRIDYYLAFAQKYPHIFDNSAQQLEIILDREILLREQENLYEKARQKNQLAGWYDLGVVSEDPWTVVLRDLVKFSEGVYGGYTRMLNRRSELERSGKDVVILIRNEGKLLLLKHFRHDDRSYHWECPRGFGETALSAEENARKEILEETGLSIDSITQMNLAEEPTAYFFADTHGTFHCNDLTEKIQNMKYVSVDEFSKMISDGNINDQFSIKAYVLAEIKDFI